MKIKNPYFLTGHKLLALTCVTVWIWIASAALLNESQLNDSLEQFIWAQSFEWGYWKHPPLSTWLMHLAIQWIGPSYLWTYALSAVLYTVTITATYKIAELIFDSDVASITAVLLTLHYGFTRRAQLYNHNSVLIAFIAVTALLTIIGLRKKRTIYWVMIGIFSGLSLLVKYQAIIPLIGILFAIALSSQFNVFKFKILIAITCAMAVVSPHFYWVTQNDWKTISYALNYIDNSEFSSTNLRTASFFVGQVRYFIPALFFIFIVWATNRNSEHAESINKTKLSEYQRFWLIGLIAFPFLAIVFFSFAIGVRLQSHWGLQTSQFLVIFLAYLLVRKFGPFNLKQALIWLTIQTVALSIFVLQGLGLIPYARENLAIRELPAQMFANQAISFWSLKTTCPLKYISGHRTMSAMISAYSEKNLIVIEDSDFTKTPWVNKLDMEQSGFLEASVSPEPSNDQNSKSIAYGTRTLEKMTTESNNFLILKFHEPLKTCHG